MVETFLLLRASIGFPLVEERDGNISSHLREGIFHLGWEREREKEDEQVNSYKVSRKVIDEEKEVANKESKWRGGIPSCLSGREVDASLVIFYCYFLPVTAIQAHLFSESES